jgi:hypothetical protein
VPDISKKSLKESDTFKLNNIIAKRVQGVKLSKNALAIQLKLRMPHDLYSVWGRPPKISKHAMGFVVYSNYF